MSHKKFGPDRFSRFDVYWIQTNKQTNKQTDKPNLYIDCYHCYCHLIFCLCIIQSEVCTAAEFLLESLGVRTINPSASRTSSPGSYSRPASFKQVTKPQPSHLNHSFSEFSLSINILIESQLNIPKIAILEFLEKKLMKGK